MCFGVVCWATLSDLTGYRYKRRHITGSHDIIDKHIQRCGCQPPAFQYFIESIAFCRAIAALDCCLQFSPNILYPRKLQIAPLDAAELLLLTPEEAFSSNLPLGLNPPYCGLFLIFVMISAR
jgi:hypothetical protein